MLASITLVISIATLSKAAEINLPGFSGSINTTVTSGISMRVDRDCLTVRGTKYLDGDTNGKFAALIATEQSTADQSVFLSDGEGCAQRYTDGHRYSAEHNLHHHLGIQTGLLWIAQLLLVQQTYHLYHHQDTWYLLQ